MHNTSAVMSRVDLKVVLLGKEYGGKTSLVERYLNDRFVDLPYQNTIGAAFGAKRLEIGSKKLTIGIWDTAGGERYEAMSRIYYRGAKGAIVCYDLTDISSFERAKFWISELRKNEENCRIYLCGTKKDLVGEMSENRKVSHSQIVRYAADINAEIYETSSKTGENVKDLFNRIAEDYTQDLIANNNKGQEDSVRLTPEHSKKLIPCCNT